MSPQLIDFPESDTTHEIAPLGYLDAYDAVLNDDYAFAAYKETDRSGGQWRVRIKSRHMTGVVFEPEMMRTQARAAGAAGKGFFTWGSGIDPSAGDARSIQYRVHLKDGRPAAIEIAVQLRLHGGAAAEPQSLMFPWPA